MNNHCLQYVGYARKYVQPKIGPEAAKILQVPCLECTRLDWSWSGHFCSVVISSPISFFIFHRIFTWSCGRSTRHETVPPSLPDSWSPSSDWPRYNINKNFWDYFSQIWATCSYLVTVQLCYLVNWQPAGTSQTGASGRSHRAGCSWRCWHNEVQVSKECYTAGVDSSFLCQAMYCTIVFSVCWTHSWMSWASWTFRGHHMVLEWVVAHR